MSPYRTPEPLEPPRPGRTWRGRLRSLWRGLLVLRGGRLRTRVVRQLVAAPHVPCGVCAERREAELRAWVEPTRHGPAGPLTASSDADFARARQIGL